MVFNGNEALLIKTRSVKIVAVCPFPPQGIV
jgi:hypothetical protein